MEQHNGKVQPTYIDTRVPCVKRVHVSDDWGEVYLVCPETGIVVYTTPTVGDFDGRALRFARRHGYEVV